MAAALDFFGDLAQGEETHPVMAETKKKEGRKSLLGKRKRKKESGKCYTFLRVHMVFSTC